MTFLYIFIIGANVVYIFFEFMRERRGRKLHHERMEAAKYERMAAEYKALKAERHYRTHKD